MGIRIEPFEDVHAPAVREFNNRVRGRKGAFEFPEVARPEWLPPTQGRRIFQEQFLAVFYSEPDTECNTGRNLCDITSRTSFQI